MKISAYMLSCPERESTRRQTLANIEATDWDEAVWVEIDGTTFERRQNRQERRAWQLVQRVAESDVDLALFLEDDLEFNRHLRHNLENWLPLRHWIPNGNFFGSLYNPNVRALERHPDKAFFVADPDSVYGSQAFIFSVGTAQYIASHWCDVIGMQDLKMSRLAARLGPIYYHTPSLVQHAGAISVWGGSYHTALDFNPEWKASHNPSQQPELLRFAILDGMRRVEGWLDDAEADLMITATVKAASLPLDEIAIVEVGSYCGKSTVVLGMAVKQAGLRGAGVYAIDPHDGKVTGLDQSILQFEPTAEKFFHNLRAAGVADVVTPLVACANQVNWSKPIAFLFIDGFHDYENVSADFNHFAAWLPPGGLVGFHDCADYFPGVKRFVNELMSQGDFKLFDQAKSLVILEKR
jgi:hypothetical protein